MTKSKEALEIIKRRTLEIDANRDIGSRNCMEDANQECTEAIMMAIPHIKKDLEILGILKSRLMILNLGYKDNHDEIVMNSIAQGHDGFEKVKEWLKNDR